MAFTDWSSTPILNADVPGASFHDVPQTQGVWAVGIRQIMADLVTASAGWGGSGGSGTVTSVSAGYGMTFATINVSGSVAVDPTVIATLSTAQVLTNKTISGATNTFSNVPISALTGGPLTVPFGGIGVATLAAGYAKSNGVSAFTSVTTIPQADVTGLTASLAGKAATTITITGATSLTGGGDLSANRTISLVNDSATPGATKYYGTDSGGTKGYFTFPATAWGTITGTLSAQTDLNTALGLKADKTITITGATSLTGGGDLSANRTISLVNDAGSPGALQYYGTDPSGVKGYFSFPTAGAVTWGSISGTLSAQSDLQTALNLKADIASPTLTGVPAAPTAAGGTNTTQIATTAFVQSAVSGLGAGTITSITNTGGGLTITNPSGPTTNIDIAAFTLAPVWDYPSLHGAVGAADDTATLAAMVTAGAAKATFLIPPYTAGAQGIYKTTGIVCAYEAEFFGVGMGMFKAITGAGILLDFPSNSLPQDGARARYVHDMEFDGDSGTYRAGAYGLKFGDATNAIVQAIASRNFMHHLELGHWSYNTQEELNDHNRIYRCKWGRLVQSDPTQGGATATKIDHCTYQYNHVGAVYDNTARFALGTTATMSNSSTALTAVASTSGLANGMVITGPGIKDGTTVAGFTVNTITLSQATTSTAAMADVPVLIKNTAGFDTEWTETGTTFQGNGVSAFACWGFNLVFNGCHFESNYQPGIATGTSTIAAVSARTVPVAPCYLSNSTVTLANNCAGGETSTAVDAWTVVDGSTLTIRDSQIATGNGMLVNGDLTSWVAFFGESNTLAGLINIPVRHWPDRFSVVNSSGWAGIGIAGQVRSATYANRNINANPRVPTVALSGGATSSYYRDATYGPVTAVQYAASAGGPFTHSADTTMIGTAVSGADKIVVSRLVRADSYTSIQFQMEAGAGNFFNYALRVTPYWQRVVLATIATNTNATAFAPALHMYPVAADGPKVYIANDMSFVGTDDDLSAIVSGGLFDDATIDGALIGSATWNPGAIAAGATVTTTITVNGLVAGDSVEVSTDIDTGALILNAWAGTNVINARLTNPTAGSITPASMVISGRAFV